MPKLLLYSYLNILYKVYVFFYYNFYRCHPVKYYFTIEKYLKITNLLHEALGKYTFRDEIKARSRVNFTKKVGS